MYGRDVWMMYDEAEAVIYLKPEYRKMDERSEAMSTVCSHKVGLVVHVNDLLGEVRRGDIEDALELESGITSAHFTDQRPHLMVVEYDPDVMTSGYILNKMGRQSVHAQLIGPV